MTPEPFERETPYQTTIVQGKLFLFTDIRVDRKTIPEGLYAYDVADGDGDGCFARIQPSVLVNYWGTIIGAEPLKLDETGHYYPEYGTAEYEGCYEDEMTLEEYMKADHFQDVSPAEDGEYAVHPGNTYRMKGKLTRPAYLSNPAYQALLGKKADDEEEYNPGFIENAIDNLSEIGVIVERIDCDNRTNEASVVFTPNQMVRTMEINDQLTYAAEAAELFWETDWPSAEKLINYKEESR